MANRDPQTTAQLRRAKHLLDQKRYKEARQILRTLDDPLARRWLQTLERWQSQADPLARELQQARRLLEAKRYDEARSILRQLDHPTARQWLQRTIAEQERQRTRLSTPRTIGTDSRPDAQSIAKAIRHFEGRDSGPPTAPTRPQRPISDDSGPPTAPTRPQRPLTTTDDPPTAPTRPQRPPMTTATAGPPSIPAAAPRQRSSEPPPRQSWWGRLWQRLRRS